MLLDYMTADNDRKDICGVIWEDNECKVLNHLGFVAFSSIVPTSIDILLFLTLYLCFN